MHGVLELGFGVSLFRGLVMPTSPLRNDNNDRTILVSLEEWGFLSHLGFSGYKNLIFKTLKSWAFTAKVVPLLSYLWNKAFMNTMRNTTCTVAHLSQLLNWKWYFLWLLKGLILVIFSYHRGPETVNKPHNQQGTNVLPLFKKHWAETFA